MELLHSSERNFELIVDNIPGLAFTMSPKGELEFVNRQVLEYFGRTLAELKQWATSDSVHPDDLPGVLAVRTPAIEAGEPFKVDAHRLRRADGIYRWFTGRTSPVRDADGRIVCWFSLLTDIEDRKRADETLRACEDQLRRIVDTIPGFVFSATVDGEIEFINQQLTECTGRLSTDIDDRKIAEDKLRHSEACLAEAQHLSRTGSFGCKLSSGEMFWSEETFRIFEYDHRTKPSVEAVLARVHPDERTMVQAHMELAKRDHTACDLECLLLLPDGGVKRVHVVAHPRREKPEDFDFVGAVMDITEQWQARTRLELALDEIKLLKDQLYEENLALRDEVDRASMFEEIVGTSQALRDALCLAVKVAPTTSSVLITGETGTGKELIARAIHKCSARADRPFVSVNCAALPSSLISSELFGHEKGAFTGAIQRRLGRFELAYGGTLFLDEIGDLPLDVQIALLRVLQEKEFERVGGTQTIRADVRVIAATNRNLEAAVASSAFRSDLLYRLNVFPIDVPPLRERKDDVLLLLRYFVRRFATEAGKTFDRIDKRTIELFQVYDWPGNVRELQNVVERSVIVSPPGVFRVDDAWLSRSGNRLPRRHPIEDLTDDAERERKLIEAALAETHGRVSGPQGAAAKLRVPPTTLDYKIKRLRIRKSQFKLDSFSKPPHS